MRSYVVKSLVVVLMYLKVANSFVTEGRGVMEELNVFGVYLMATNGDGNLSLCSASGKQSLK